jgi:Flp pilus assembly protein TadG
VAEAAKVKKSTRTPFAIGIVGTLAPEWRHVCQLFRLTKTRWIADEEIVEVRPSRIRRTRTRRSQEGFVLIVTSIALTILLALAALGIDIGRMYVIRAELQSFTDAAALSAAIELNGTDQGLANARAGAGRLATGPHAMQWDLGTRPITNIATSFSAENKTWQEQPKPAGDYRFVRVVATAPAPVIFLRVFQPMGLGSSTVSAASVAAKTQDNARLIR